MAESRVLSFAVPTATALADRVGKKAGLKLPGDLASGQRLQISDADLRMVAERGLVRLLEGELWRPPCAGERGNCGNEHAEQSTRARAYRFGDALVIRCLCHAGWLGRRASHRA